MPTVAVVLVSRPDALPAELIEEVNEAFVARVLAAEAEYTGGDALEEDEEPI